MNKLKQRTDDINSYLALQTLLVLTKPVFSHSTERFTIHKGASQSLAVVRSAIAVNIFYLELQSFSNC